MQCRNFSGIWCSVCEKSDDERACARSPDYTTGSSYTCAASSLTPAATPAPVATTAAVAPQTYTTAQLDQWVAPIALYPDQLLSQVLMASTYPANVVQAVQWSRDNPKQQGDAAIQAVANSRGTQA